MAPLTGQATRMGLHLKPGTAGDAGTRMLPDCRSRLFTRSLMHCTCCSVGRRSAFLLKGCKFCHSQILSKWQLVQDYVVRPSAVALLSGADSGCMPTAWLAGRLLSGGTRPSCSGAVRLYMMSRKAWDGHLYSRMRLTRTGVPAQIAGLPPVLSETRGRKRMSATDCLLCRACTKAASAVPDFSLPFSATITHGSCIAWKVSLDCIAHSCRQNQSR